MIKEGYIRVTELLKPWRKVTPELEEITAKKAIIGTNVHEAITSHILGMPIKELSEREKKYFNCYKDWESNSKVNVLQHSERLYDEVLKLTGEIDCIVDLNGPTIVDFKTSANASLKEWSVQLGWYYLLCHHNKIFVKDIVYILQLNDKDKKAKLHQINIAEELKSDCISIYSAYIYFKGLPSTGN